MKEFLFDSDTIGVLTWFGVLLTAATVMVPWLRRNVALRLLSPLKRLKEPYDAFGTLKLILNSRKQLADLRMSLQIPGKAIGYVGGMVLGSGLIVGMLVFLTSVSPAKDPFNLFLTIILLFGLFSALLAAGSHIDRLNNPEKWLNDLRTNLQKRKERLAASAEWSLVKSSVEEQMSTLEAEIDAILAWVQSRRDGLLPHAGAHSEVGASSWWLIGG